MTAVDRLYSARRTLSSDMTIVDVGAGHDPDPRATTTVDVDPAADPDVTADLTDRWPFDDDSVDAVIARHVVEHLEDPVHFFREAARVLRLSGVLEVTVPIGEAALTDPDHEQRWTFTTPLVFDRGYSIEAGRHWDPEVPFTLEDRELDLTLYGPFKPLTPALNALAKKWPSWAVHRAASGELTAVYRRRLGPAYGSSSRSAPPGPTPLG